MATKPKPQPVYITPVFPRADPQKLKDFDPRTRLCVMNCGPHRDDPRTRKERRFLCGDCHDQPVDAGT